MGKFNPLPSLIQAASQDAGCAHMRAAGRAAWDHDDYDYAAETHERLVRACYARPSDGDARMCFVRFGMAAAMERARAFTLKSDFCAVMAAIDAALA